MKSNGRSAFTTLLLGTVLLLSPVVTHAQVLKQDSLALVALYHATGGDNWTNNTNWLQPGQNVSTWYGVTEQGNRVTEVVLNDNNLNGSIPDEMGSLTKMHALALGLNHLSGSIPPGLANSHTLGFLALTGNDLTGEIPSFLLQMTPPGSSGKFRIILLAKNNFTGISPLEGAFNHNMSTLSIEENGLDFSDIEPLFTEIIPAFFYSPQAPIYTEEQITVREGATLSIKTTTGGSANHYQWFNDNVAIPSAQSSTYTFNVTPDHKGEYTAQITNNIVTGLTLHRNPLTLHVAERIIYTSCNGEPVSLDVTVSDPQATYTWSNGQTTPVIEVSTSDHYSVRIETANYIIEDVYEVVIPVALSLGPDIDTCDPTVTLSSNAPNADSFEWTTPTGSISGQSSISATTSGQYTLEVIQEGCEQETSVEVVLNRFTEGDFTMTAGSAVVADNGTVLTGVPLTFVNNGGTGSSFSWSFGDGDTSSEEEPRHNYTKAGEYTVSLQGRDNRDCLITVEKTLIARDIRITNAISPNGDGKNDKLYIEPFLYSAEFKVINRWGQQVYTTSSYHDDFTGANLESGVYFYELYFKEIDRSFKGHVHIMK